MSAIPKTFVIGLQKMPERWKVTEAHLKEVGIEPTVFLGLYGKDANLFSTQDIKSNLYFKLTPNRIALALNHWFLWNHVALSDLPAAIVFEDDIILPLDFKDYFAACMADMPFEWDLTYLSILYPERMKDGRIGAEKLKGNVWHHTGARTWDGACDGAHAYMLSHEGARKMAAVPFTLNSPVDRWMSFNLLPLLRTYIWYPSPIKTRTEWTSTTDFFQQ